MDLTHRFTVPVAIDDAWAAFNDLERIAPCFPGADLTSYDGEEFTGLVKVKLGPISMQYTGTGRFVERDEADHRAVIEAKGKDKRGNGTAAASITARLVEGPDNATDVEVVTSLNITGKPAQFGRGVMQDVSDKLLGQFSACLETKLAVQTGELDSEPQAEPQPEPAGSEPGPLAPEPAEPRAESPPERGGVADDGVVGAELDLGTTVLPILLKRYAPIVGGFVGLTLLWRLVRRARR